MIVIGVTLLTVYLTGVNYNRTVTSNLYLSLLIIGSSLFLFMTYGLFKGIDLTDNFPKFRRFKSGDFLPTSGEFPDVDLPSISIGEGIGEVIVSILLWIGMTILFFILLFVLEAAFWISIFIILAMLYWVFFRALRLVFSRSTKTKGDIGLSASYSIMYTILYLGWLAGIVYLTEILR